MAIPTKDAACRDYAVNFDTLVTANPPRYGLVVLDGTTIHTYVSDFVAKLLLAKDPATRTKVTIAAKDGAKSSMLVILRGYGAQVKANRGVSDDDKVALGL